MGAFGNNVTASRSVCRSCRTSSFRTRSFHNATAGAKYTGDDNSFGIGSRSSAFAPADLAYDGGYSIVLPSHGCDSESYCGRAVAHAILLNPVLSCFRDSPKLGYSR
jgi:hypothetical protein